MEDALGRRVQAMMVAAGRAWSDGRPDEMKRILRQIEIEAPNHPVAMNEDAQRRIGAGDFLNAKRILTAAIQIDSAFITLWENLAIASRGLGLPAEEQSALDKILELDPRNLRALLQAGVLREKQGDTKVAAAVYRRALETSARMPRQPPELAAHLQHAEAVVAANATSLENFLDSRLSDTRAEADSASLRRFDKCMATVLKKQPIYRSTPSFMYFPELPTIEFFDRDLFPWLDRFEAAADDIRDEFVKVYREDAAKLEPYVTGVTLKSDVWWELNQSPRWSVYYLWRLGTAVGENLQRCSITAEALEHWPKCELRGTGPSAVFSILAAKTSIPPHSGVNNARLTVHLPLIVPPDCWFRVGSETREWEAGKAFVFDDTIEHEAWNGSDVPRTVLIMDVWNPFLTEVERKAVTALTDGVGEFYGPLPAYI